MAYDPRQWFSYSKLYRENTNEAHSTSLNQSESNTNEDDYHYIPSHSNFYEPSSEKNNSTNKYAAGALSIEQESDEYDPCAPAINKISENILQVEQDFRTPDPRKLDYYISTLQKMIRPIPLDYKKKLPYDVICQLAHAILDGTVFEIAKGLQDIQKIMEKNLSTKRMKLVNEQKAKKAQMWKRHQNEIESSQSRPHQILILEKHHAEEKKIFDQKCELDLTSLDQKLVLDLDQQMSDQQATLQRAGLPLFYITNNPEDTRLQMYVLEFIMKLAAG